MALTQKGRNFIALVLLTTGAPTVFNNTNAKLGVGASTVAFDPAVGNLVGSSGTSRKGMEAGYPQSSTNTMIFKSSYGSTSGNFNWNEIGVFNGATTAANITMLCRVVSAQGTKGAGATWTLTHTVTVST